MKGFTLLAVIFSLLAVYTTSMAAKDGQIYKDWKIQCAKDKAGNSSDYCHIFQNLVSKEGDKRILHIAVGYAPGHKDPAVIITMPLGLSLPPGVTIQVDENQSKRFPFQACFQTGCQVGFPLDNVILNQYKSGNKAIITFFDLKRQSIKIPVSLSGFSAAIKALKVTQR